MKKRYLLDLHNDSTMFLRSMISRFFSPNFSIWALYYVVGSLFRVFTVCQTVFVCLTQFFDCCFDFLTQDWHAVLQCKIPSDGVPIGSGTFATILGGITIWNLWSNKNDANLQDSACTVRHYRLNYFASAFTDWGRITVILSPTGC